MTENQIALGTKIRMNDMKEKHFLLVHGGCHGAWCWFKVATLLRSEGHKFTALDMAASGVNKKQVQEIHSFLDYFQPLIEYMASLPAEEKVVLVGHSFGGFGLSLAMERFPEKIAVAIFVSSSMPGPDLSYVAILNEINKLMDLSENSDQPIFLSHQVLASRLYQLSPQEDLTLASMLVRPHPSLGNASKLSEEMMFTAEKYGSVRRVFVVVDQDMAFPEEIQRWMIKLNPPDEVKVINGSDHMAMLSKPKELCSCLGEIAQQYY